MREETNGKDIVARNGACKLDLGRSRIARVGPRGCWRANSGSAGENPTETRLLSLCQSRVPDPPVLRRYARAYLVFYGCGGIRRSARTEGCLSVCARGAGDIQYGAAREALAPARLPRRNRPLR